MSKTGNDNKFLNDKKLEVIATIFAGGVLAFILVKIIFF